MSRAWTWMTAGPQERAEMVRSHQQRLGPHATMKLFNLSEEGERMIRNGDIWRPYYEVAENDIALPTDTGSVT